MRAKPMLVAAVAAALAVAGCGGADGGRAGGATAAGGATSAGGTAAAAAPRASGPSRASGVGASDSDRSDAAADAGPDVILVRRAGGVPDGWGARLRRIQGVTAVTRATRAQALLRATGARRVRAGFAVPLDTLVVRPRGYARMLPAADRALLARLGPGRALLSRSEARLRRARVGATLTLAGGRRLRVAGIVADGLVRSSQLVVSPSEGARLATRAPYLLAVVRTPRAARRVERIFGTAPRSAVSALGPAPWNRRGLIARTRRPQAALRRVRPAPADRPRLGHARPGVDPPRHPDRPRAGGRHGHVPPQDDPGAARGDARPRPPRPRAPRRPRRLRRLLRATPHSHLGDPVGSRLGPRRRPQRRPQPAGSQAPSGPAPRARHGAPRLPVGRALADRPRRHAL